MVYDSPAQWTWSSQRVFGGHWWSVGSNELRTWRAYQPSPSTILITSENEFGLTFLTKHREFRLFLGEDTVCL